VSLCVGQRRTASNGPQRAFRRRVPQRCRNACRCDLFDLERVHLATRIPRPPTVPLLVITVVVPKPRRVELGHSSCILPELKQRLQRTASDDLTLVIEYTMHDLKHRSPLAANACRCGRCVSYSSPWAPLRPTLSMPRARRAVRHGRKDRWGFALRTFPLEFIQRRLRVYFQNHSEKHPLTCLVEDAARRLLDPPKCDDGCDCRRAGAMHQRREDDGVHQAPNDQLSAAGLKTVFTGASVLPKATPATRQLPRRV
jgi:hypothetical protein